MRMLEMIEDKGGIVLSNLSNGYFREVYSF